RAIEIAGLRKIFRGAEQHDGMAVMAAAMHLAVDARAMRKIIFLLQVKRIHVRAKADGAVAITALERADDAGLGEAAVHFDSKARQLFGNKVGGFMFFESRF